LHGLFPVQALSRLAKLHGGFAYPRAPDFVEQSVIR
jgi:hypothetical protein